LDPAEMKTTKPKPFVFVLMPFAPEFDDVYKFGIKLACEKAGAYAERVDEQIFNESILDRIYTQISKSDVVISDMTGRSPNVFYETGYAHALGKNVVLLTQSADDIPFDLKHYPHIIYKGRISDLADELEKRVRWAIENPQGLEKHAEFELSFYHEGTEITSGLTTKYYADFDVGAWNRFKLDLHNRARKLIKSVSFQLGIVTPKDVGSIRIRDRHLTRVNLDNKEYLHLVQSAFYILPGAWQSVPLDFRAEGKFEPGMSLPIVMRVFSEIGFIDHSFVLELSELTIESEADIGI
jgi:nucleoside 2-deoxyribosyltransferase